MPVHDIPQQQTGTLRNLLVLGHALKEKEGATLNVTIHEADRIRRGLDYLSSTAGSLLL
jgi:hypothetical protein